MLKINGNKLSAEGVEFLLPNGFYIDTEGMESVDKNGIRLVPEEQDCFIWIRTENDEYETAMDSLLDTFSDFIYETGSAIELFENSEKTEYQWIDKPRAFKQNGLKGACVIYTALTKDVYRMHFEKVEGFCERFVIFMQVDRTKTDIKSVLERPHVQMFFDNVCILKF